MKNLYFSAGIKLQNGVICVIGMKVSTKNEDVDIEQMRIVYEYMIKRYFGEAEIQAFALTNKKEFKTKTNLTIKTEF